MTKSVIGKATILALATCFGAAAVVGCTSEGARSSEAATTGSLDMELLLSNGAQVDSATYTITGNGISPITGSFPVQQVGDTVELSVQGLPEGTGYTVTISAESDDGLTTCEGSSTFDIVANSTTNVSVAMQCRTVGKTGSVGVEGTFNNCPVVTSVIGVPLTVAIGNSISVSSTASDADGDMLTYDWSDGSSSFSSGANGSYQCSTIGAVTLTLTVSDNECDTTATVNGKCVAAPGCGNGNLDSGAGEECDDGNTESGDGCSDVCLTEVCGNGRVDAGEECDDGNTASGDGCSASCEQEGCGNGRQDAGEECDDGNAVSGDGCDSQCRTEECGNGRVDAGEDCEPPGQDGCDESCHTACGNGVIDPGEDCEPPGEGDCSAECTLDQCLACEKDACPDRVAECYDQEGTATSGRAKAEVCADILQCVRDSGCAANAAEDCYCGGLDVGTCAATPLASVTGACKDLIAEGADSDVSLTIASRFVNPAYATGTAFRLLRCDDQSCSGVCE